MKLAFLGVLILLLPIAYADADFSGPLKEYYNLGDKIPVEVALTNTEPGLLKVSIDCNSRSVLYYVTPIDSGSPSKITVPDYTASQSLIGDCHITLSVDSLDGNAKSQESSSGFKVTNEILIDSVSDKLEYKPGEAVKLSGSIRKKSGASLRNATLHVTLDDETKILEAKEGFSYSLPIKQASKSGKKEIVLMVRDGDLNEGSTKVPFNLLPKASSMQVIINGKEFMPKSSVEFRIAVYDQAEEIMKIPVKTEIRNPKGTTIQSMETMSGIISAFSMEDFAMPGTYTIKGSVGGISGESRFYIKQVVEIQAKYEDQIVTITNTGNVLFENKTTIILEGDGKKIMLTRDISLEPGAHDIIDLSREVPSGTYSVSLPEGAVGDDKFLKDIYIKDNRPLAKRIQQGLLGITGNTLGISGSSSLKMASYIMIAILVGLVIYYMPKDRLRNIKFPRFSFSRPTTGKQRYINRILGNYKK
ncbi:hypothetical protein HY638_00975 [Candidatus Woesearchaeota archaeon]|nr:hypothetical protein [Candidatus Woesearchaeota archaeon]